MRACGGCEGCQQSVGVIASRYGDAAEACEGFGDMVGPNDTQLANTLWAVSSKLRAIANEHKARYQQADA